ncbi:Calcium load-activated calcium channel [Sparganum proliferum]
MGLFRLGYHSTLTLSDIDTGTPFLAKVYHGSLSIERRSTKNCKLKSTNKQNDVSVPFCIHSVVEKQRDSTMETNIDKATKKRLEKQEEKLKNFNRDLSLVKMKSMFAIGVIFTALFSVFNHTFDGRVVARLPFVPISWLQNLSHRNLPGSDYTDCSFIFLYILCTMSIRQNVQKMLGFAPSRASLAQNSFGAAQ